MRKLAITASALVVGLLVAFGVVRTPTIGAAVPPLVVNELKVGVIDLTGVITPSSISGTVNNYSPTSGDTATRWRQAASAPATITGIALPTSGNVDGRIVILRNIGAQPITVANENTSSTAANRLSLPGAQDWTIAAGGAITIYYDATSLRWSELGMGTNVLPATQVVGTFTQSGGTANIGAGQNVSIGSSASTLVALAGARITATDNGTPVDSFDLNTAAGLTIAGKITLSGATTQQSGAFTAGAGNNVTLGDASSPATTVRGLTLTATSPALTLSDTAGTPHTIALVNASGITETGTTAIVGALTQTAGAFTAAANNNATIGNASSTTVSISGATLTATSPALTLSDTAGTPHTIALANASGITETGTTAIVGALTQTAGAFTAAANNNVTLGNASSTTVNITGAAINLTGGDLTGTQTGNTQWVASQVINQSAGGLTVAQSALTFLANLRPSALAASQNNYAPSGGDNVSLFYLTPNAAGSTITGFRTGSTNQPNRMVMFYNLSTTASITLTNQDAGSTASNRFVTPGAASLVIGPGLGAILAYDPTQSRWVVFGLG